MILTDRGEKPPKNRANDHSERHLTPSVIIASFT